MMPRIHPTAVVEPGARLAEDVTVGPYCVVGAEVELGANVELVAHVVIAGRTRIGASTKVYPFASLGQPPQDLKYKGEPSHLLIGANNVIREHVTMSPGTAGGGLVTRVGDHGLFMVGVHIAHDCQVGDHVVMANCATLGGHVHVGDYAIFGGLTAVHQFVRIGRFAMIGGMSGVESDVIPFGSVMGDRARLSGLNIIGLKRRGFSRDDIHTLRTAYRLLFAQEGTMAERLEDVAGAYAENRPVMELVEFIRADSSRAICQPKTQNAA
jgi:UDP-N-acetylglucosamine acyltransferase